MKKPSFLKLLIFSSTVVALAATAGEGARPSQTTTLPFFAARRAEDPHVHTQRVGDYWGGSGTPGTSIPNSQIWNAHSVTGLGGDGNADWGAVASDWGATIAAKEGQNAQITYRIGAEDQKLIGGHVTGKFRFWNGNSEQLHNGDRIFVDVSKDNVNWTRLAHYGHVGVESSDPNAGVNVSFNDPGTPLTFDIDIAAMLENLDFPQYAYVKFTMMHYLSASAELGLWGMFVHDTAVEYQTKDASIIHYELGGGTLPADAKDAFFYDDTTIYTLPTPTRENYVFSGWKKGEEIVKTFDPQGGSATLVAQWDLPQTAHRIEYVDSLGAENPNPESFNESDEQTLILTDLEKPGYRFLGWYDAMEGGKKVERIVPAETKGDVKLFARWSENEYDITYKIDDQLFVTFAGGETLPSKIKTTGVFEFTVTAKEGYGIAYVKVDGVCVELANGAFSIRGDALVTHNIEAVSYRLNQTQTSPTALDFTSLSKGDDSWRGQVYDAHNLRVVSDNPANVGLSIVENGPAHLVLKYVARENFAFDSLAVSGFARLFDFNNGETVETNLKVYLSANNADFKLIKQFVATNLTSGDEVVSLSFDKALDETMDELYLKVELNGTAGQDWAVLKQLGVELTETEKAPLPPAPDSTTSEPQEESTSPVLPPESSSSEPAVPSESGNNVGLIVGLSVGGAILALLGIGLGVFFFFKRRK